MRTVATTVNVEYVDERTELFAAAGREQLTCRMSLHLDTGVLTAWTDYEPSMRTQDAHLGIERQWKIPCLTRDDANSLLRYVADHAQAILDDARMECDQFANWRGYLGTTGDAAEDGIRDIITEYENLCTSLHPAYMAEYFDDAEEAFKELKLSSTSTDANIRAAVDEYADEVIDMVNGVLDIDDAIRYLTEHRGTQRAAIADVLEEIGDSSEAMACARTRRDRAIVTARGAGVSLAAIAAAAGLTPEGVRKIIARERG